MLSQAGGGSWPEGRSELRGMEGKVDMNGCREGEADCRGVDDMLKRINEVGGKIPRGIFELNVLSRQPHLLTNLVGGG